ncbi:hypothetical protein LFM09_12425 [Lentzea alba]|uniref:hypothetical protein n=1 Tax=Lentzea alba TaxID=2714351 RepID=UPI0039BEEBB6
MSSHLIARAGLTEVITGELAADRHGPVVFAGEAGSGRSTVLAAIADMIDDRADALLRLRGAPGRLTALREHLPRDFRLPKAGGFGSVTDALLAAVAGRRPVVLVDDVHLADHATVEVLRSVQVRTNGLLFMTMRSDVGADPLDCLRYEPGFRRVEVPPFTAAEVAEMAAAAGRGTAPVEALRAATGGNPLLLRQHLAAGARIDLDARGRERLRTAISRAWRDLSLNVLDELCRLALLAGEDEAAELVWPQTLLLRGQAQQAVAHLDRTESTSSDARSLVRAIVLAFGFGDVPGADAALRARGLSPRLNAVRAWLFAVSGRLDQARTALGEATAGTDRTSAVFTNAALAAIALAEDRPAVAVSALRRALIGAEGLSEELPWLPPHLSAALVDSLLLLGRVGEATTTAAGLGEHPGQRAAAALGSRLQMDFQQVNSR